MSSRAVVHVVRMAAGKLSIFDQLCLEEALLRADKRNWCILNYGQSPPTIVMGISGQLQALVNIPLTTQRKVPVLRRFTGGGTVVTDAGTVYASFIFNKADIQGQPLYPREVMKWSETFYAPLFDRFFTPPGGNKNFSSISDTPSSSSSSLFALREHDYVFGDKKFGGNAQSISRDRWVHHTSLLWDFDPSNMELLQLPVKRPEYRRDRPHTDFLTTLKHHFHHRHHQHDSGGGSSSSSVTSGEQGRHVFMDAIVERLHEVADVRFVELEEAQRTLLLPQERRGNSWVLTH